MEYENESKYAGACVPQSIGRTTALTLKERLKYAVDAATRQLAEAQEAAAIFERNPDLERLLNIMQKGNF